MSSFILCGANARLCYVDTYRHCTTRHVHRSLEYYIGLVWRHIVGTYWVVPEFLLTCSCLPLWRRHHGSPPKGKSPLESSLKSRWSPESDWLLHLRSLLNWVPVAPGLSTYLLIKSGRAQLFGIWWTVVHCHSRIHTYSLLNTHSLTHDIRLLNCINIMMNYIHHRMGSHI